MLRFVLILALAACAAAVPAGKHTPRKEVKAHDSDGKLHIDGLKELQQKFHLGNAAAQTVRAQMLKAEGHEGLHIKRSKKMNGTRAKRRT